jgi:hypothetical protein
VTVQDKTGTLPPHLTFNYDEHGVLMDIFVFPGSDCQTSKGIKIGDSQKKVQKLYGKGKKSTPYFKGEKLGDFVLEYPGVQFAFLKGKVAIICILANDAEKGGTTGGWRIL